jgi:hypothetical protein
MKGILTFALLTTILNTPSYAEAEKSMPSTGTSAVDEQYTDELKTKKAAIEKNEAKEVDKTWNGQGQIYSKEDDQKMEEMKDEPGGEDAEGLWKDLGKE